MDRASIKAHNRKAARIRNLARAFEARRRPDLAGRMRTDAQTIAAGALAGHLGDERRAADEAAHPVRTDAELSADLAGMKQRIAALARGETRGYAFDL